MALRFSFGLLDTCTAPIRADVSQALRAKSLHPKQDSINLGGVGFKGLGFFRV